MLLCFYSISRVFVYLIHLFTLKFLYCLSIGQYEYTKETRVLDLLYVGTLQSGLTL